MLSLTAYTFYKYGNFIANEKIDIKIKYFFMELKFGDLIFKSVLMSISLNPSLKFRQLLFYRQFLVGDAMRDCAFFFETKAIPVWKKISERGDGYSRTFQSVSFGQQRTNNRLLKVYVVNSG